MFLCVQLSPCASCSQSPEVKQIDMLHAVDYENMDLHSLKSAMEKRKNLDNLVETTMMWVFQK